MNALVSIENIKVLTPAAFDALTPAVVFAPGGVEGILCKIETEVRAIDRDISTPDGRENVKSLAYKVARSKTALDDMGKELVSGIKAQAATIDAERRTIRDRLDALKEEVRGPLTAWETAEAERIAGHESALVAIVDSSRFSAPPSVAIIRDRIAEVSHYAGRDWQEFKVRGDTAIYEALQKLGTMKEAAKQAERDAAELAELRRLKIEREEADRKAAEAAHAAEQARLVAEARAAREAQEAAAAAAREHQLAERIEREKAEAFAAGIERENRRIAEAHAATEAAKLKRESNQRHRAKVHKAILDALMTQGFAGPEANDLIGMIAAGAIPHLSITYY